MNGMELKKLMDVTVAKAVKEFAEKLKKKLFDFFEDNEELDGKISTGVLYVEIIGVENQSCSLQAMVVPAKVFDEILRRGDEKWKGLNTKEVCNVRRMEFLIA